MTAIYRIVSPTNKMYIGQSRNVDKRLKYYKGLQCKKQPAIYRSLLKHGVDKHEFRIEMRFSDGVPQDILNHYECAYMEATKKAGYELLNIRGGGHNGLMAEETKKALSEKKKGIPRPYYKGENNPYYGKKHSEEIRQRMSKANKGNKVGTRNGRARAINQYDLNGSFLKEWATITEASTQLQIFRQAISDNLNGRNKSSGGFIWKYKL